MLARIFTTTTLLLLLTLAACTKEDSLQESDQSATFGVSASIQFDAGNQHLLLSNIESDFQTTAGPDGCNCLDPNAEPTPGSTTAFVIASTYYQASNQTLVVSRQDAGTDPNFKFSIAAELDLDAIQYPYTVQDPLVYFEDLHNQLQASDNPDHQNAPQRYTAVPSEFELVLTERNNNRIQGYFQGKVQTADGLELELQNGTIHAALYLK
jgi:hypothetical protein